MSKLKSLTTLALMLVLAACSGSGSGFATDPNVPTDPGTPPVAAVSAVTVLASSPSMPSDNSQTLTISAIVTDANRVAMEGVTVVMSTDSGFLTIDNAVTDASGVATATLSNGGDPTNRPITVTADARGVAGSVTINVIGTALTLTGPAALAQNDRATYTMVLTDASGTGIANETISVTSQSGNTLSATSLTTDVSGQAQIQLTATVSGSDTLQAAALGLQAQRVLTVSDDSFALTAPVAGTEINLNTAAAVTLNWSIGAAPQVGQPISFSATRGTLSSFTANTDASGNATVSIQSNNAGAAVIEATNAAGTSTQVTVEFVATTPANIEVQATPFTIGPNEQSAITAIVRDAGNNLVKNAVVVFDLTDSTGGQLSVASAATDSQGRASTFYNSSSTTSANNGVRIKASVQANPAVTDFVDLTVARRELFISLGTGNTIFEPNSAQYRKEYVVQITDSQGNGVSDVDVQVGILSEFYNKGVYLFVDPIWVPSYSVQGCLDEDQNRNGVLDQDDPATPADESEDTNGSGRIEAGNIASVVAQAGVGGTITTDAGGFGIVDIFYPQEYANWVDVALTATTAVQGTEFAKTARFRLPVAADDIDDAAEEPPGNPSPFGTSSSCLDTD
ncbi:MAG: Ig-like domain-containing protein [Woeseia sp.]